VFSPRTGSIECGRRTRPVYRFCAYTVSTDSEIEMEPFLYSGPDCMDEFYEHLAHEQARIVDIMRLNVAMLPLTAEEQQHFDRTQWCRRCYETFGYGNEKVRHHNYRCTM
jgi:hypothetical protein